MSTMVDDRLFDSSKHDGIAKGSCVLLLDDEIVYAGPLKGAPDVTGKMVLLNPDDFERLRAHVDRGRH